MTTLLSDDTTPASKAGRGRRIGRRVALTLATLLPGLLALGALGSLLGGTHGGAHRFHDFTHFVWLLLLVVAPYALQWSRPEAKVALWQAAAVSAPVLVVGGLLAGVSDPVFYVAFPLFAFLVWLTHPARSTLLGGGSGISPVMAPLAAVAAIPGSLYVAEQLELQRNLAGDIHGALVHYGGQGLAVLFILVFAVIASMRTRGWQWTAGLASVAGFLIGVGSIVFAGQSGTWSAAASAGVIVLSGAFGAAAVWEARRG